MPLLVHSVIGHQLYPLAQYFSRSVGMVFDAIHLRNWLKLNWAYDCTFLCEVEDERSNSQFVCILSGSTKNQPVALVFKGHSCKNLFSFSFNFDDGSKPLFSIPILLSCDILQ